MTTEPTLATSLTAGRTVIDARAAWGAARRADNALKDAIGAWTVGDWDKAWDYMEAARTALDPILNEPKPEQGAAARRDSLDAATERVKALSDALRGVALFLTEAEADAALMDAVDAYRVAPEPAPDYVDLTTCSRGHVIPRPPGA